MLYAWQSSDEEYTILRWWLQLLFVGSLIIFQQHASVSQKWICFDNCMCCYTEIEVADQIWQALSPSTDPMILGTWQGSHWSTNFKVTGKIWSGAGIMEADNRLVMSFHSPTVIPPSVLDKSSIMKRYHRWWMCSHTSPRHSPRMVRLHDTQFVECRWWNDGWTVVTWRSPASMIPAPGKWGFDPWIFQTQGRQLMTRLPRQFA